MPRLRTLIAVLAGLLIISACGADAESPAAEPIDIELGDSVTLDNGDQVRVTARDAQELWVQFRAEGEGWSEPERVYAETDRWTHEVEVLTAGDTVAINAGFWTQRVLDDDYHPQQTIQVICHDGSCSDAAASEYITSTSFNPDGTVAWYPLTPTRFALWSVDDGLSEVSPDGLDGSPYGVQDDGSLTFLNAETDGTTCRFVLSATEPGGGEAKRVAESRGLDHSGPCELGTARVEAGEVVASAVDFDPDEQVDPSLRTTFTRGDAWDEWSVTEPENPVVVIPESESTIGTVFMLLADGGTVALSSPDQLSITAQVQEVGETEWSPVEEVARAPRGTQCRSLTPGGGLYEDAEVGAFVTIYCDDAQFAAAEPGSVGLILATNDGARWFSEELTDPRHPVLIGSDVLGYGSNGLFLWRAGSDGFRRLDLRVDSANDALTVSPDGERLVRFTAGPNPTTDCRPGWSVASLDATDWPAAEPLPKVGELAGEGCLVEKAWTILEDNREISRTVVTSLTDPAADWTGAVVPDRSGALKAYASEDIPD